MEQPTDPSLIKQYLLSIHLSSEGFNISVFDETRVLLSSKKITVSLFSLSVEDIIKVMTPEILLNYRTVRLICESDTYTFIPAPIFKTEEAADTLYFQFKPVSTDQIMLNRIPKWDTVNVFSIPKSLHIALSQLFPKTVIVHHLSYLLTEYIKFQSENAVYIAVRGNMMDVAVIQKGTLQLINNYSFNTPEDFTYYTLNLFDKLQLDTENFKVVLFNGEKTPELKKSLELYLEVINGQH